MPERNTVNQRIQFGPETTNGTNVAAGKVVGCFDLVLGLEADVTFYRPTGRKYENTQEENTEWASGTLGGNFDYNGCLYPLDSIMGTVTPTAAGSSAIAKLWTYIPPVTGNATPRTYTIEQGDSVRAHKVNYALFTQYGYKGTRKDMSNSGKIISQPLQDGITMTSSPTAIALAPIAGKHLNYYLDSTSAGLGTTQLLRVLSFDFSFDNVYGPFFAFNRSTVGFTAHSDLAPKTTAKIKFEADANGMAPLSYLQQGTTYFLRVEAIGAVIDNNQTVTIGGGATSGNFTLTYKGQTTANIAYSASLTASTVQTAFQLLSTVSTNCTVSGPNGGPYVFTFSSALATDTTAMTATNVTLTGGAPTIVVTQTQIYNKFVHDMAIKFEKPAAFGDDQGVFAIEWPCRIVEDFTWGKAQQISVTNLITAL